MDSMDEDGMCCCCGDPVGYQHPDDPEGTVTMLDECSYCSRMVCSTRLGVCRYYDWVDAQCVECISCRDCHNAERNSRRRDEGKDSNDDSDFDTDSDDASTVTQPRDDVMEMVAE